MQRGAGVSAKGKRSRIAAFELSAGYVARPIGERYYVNRQRSEKPHRWLRAGRSDRISLEQLAMIAKRPPARGTAQLANDDRWTRGWGRERIGGIVAHFF